MIKHEEKTENGKVMIIVKIETSQSSKISACYRRACKYVYGLLQHYTDNIDGYGLDHIEDSASANKCWYCYKFVLLPKNRPSTID